MLGLKENYDSLALIHIALMHICTTSKLSLPYWSRASEASEAPLSERILRSL